MYEPIDLLSNKRAISMLTYEEADDYLLYRSKRFGFSTDFLQYKTRNSGISMYPSLNKTLTYVFSQTCISKKIYTLSVKSGNLRQMYGAIAKNLNNPAVIKFINKNVIYDEFLYGLYMSLTEKQIMLICNKISVPKYKQAISVLNASDSPLSIKSVIVMEILC